MAAVRTYAEEAAFIERVNGHSYRHALPSLCADARSPAAAG
jgi:hypothetical protein